MADNSNNQRVTYMADNSNNQRVTYMADNRPLAVQLHDVLLRHKTVDKDGQRDMVALLTAMLGGAVAGSYVEKNGRSVDDRLWSSLLNDVIELITKHKDTLCPPKAA